MNIIAVDDERPILENFLLLLRNCIPNSTIHGFRKASEALTFAQHTHCDIAFLDVEMCSMDGIELGKRLKLINTKINIIFVTAYNQYMGDALSMYASGYILKPATAQCVLRELENLRHPIVLNRPQKRIRLQAFGNFEVFIDESPIKFQYTKTKELLAYLVDRKGASCTNQEIISILWEDDSSSSNRLSYLRNLYADLISSFTNAGVPQVIIKQRGTIALAPEAVSCDYFDWLNGSIHAINTYQGEYMTQYSWGEFTLGLLSTC